MSTEHAHEAGESFLTGYLDILTSPAHLAAEVTMFAGESLVGAVIGMVALRVHDRRRHPKHPESTPTPILEKQEV